MSQITDLGFKKFLSKKKKKKFLSYFVLLGSYYTFFAVYPNSCSKGSSCIVRKSLWGNMVFL